MAIACGASEQFDISGAARPGLTRPVVAGRGCTLQQGEQCFAIGVPDSDRQVVGFQRTGKARQPGRGFAGLGGWD